MTIDTLKLQRHFLQTGFSEMQAESLIEALRTAEEQAATKEDIQLLRRGVGEDVQLLRRDMDENIQALRRDMELLKKDLTLKMYAVGATVIAAFNFL